MKKYLCLVLILGLCACDFDKTPKCWDDTLKKNFLENTTYTTNGVKYSATQLGEITELKAKDGSKICNISITFSDGSVHNFSYTTIYAKTQTGRTVRYLDLTEF